MNNYEIVKVGAVFYVIAKRHNPDSEIVKLTEDQKHDPFKRRPYWTYPSVKTFADGPFETYELANTFINSL